MWPSSPQRALLSRSKSIVCSSVEWCKTMCRWKLQSVSWPLSWIVFTVLLKVLKRFISNCFKVLIFQLSQKIFLEINFCHFNMTDFTFYDLLHLLFDCLCVMDKEGSKTAPSDTWNLSNRKVLISIYRSSWNIIAFAILISSTVVKTVKKSFLYHIQFHSDIIIFAVLREMFVLPSKLLFN